MSLVLAMLMVVSFALTACTPSGSTSEKEEDESVVSSESVPSSDPSSDPESDPESESTITPPVVDEGEQIDFNFKVDSDAPVTYPTDPTVMPGMNEVKEGHTYTYNVAASKLPTNWNIHDYQTNTATMVTDYTTDSMYTFDFNTSLDGYRIVPSMATDFPEDVTADYYGQYGVEEGDANRVYKITLKDDLKFDNGDPITAATFVESMKLLLNPKALNYRADTYFKGNLVIHNARAYALQGSTVLASARDKYDTWEEAKADPNIVFDILTNNTGFGTWASNNYPSYYDKVKDTGWAWLTTGLGAETTPEAVFALQDKNWAEIEADPALKAAWDAVIAMWQTDPNEELDFFGYYDKMPATDFADVGFFVDPTDDNSLIIVNDNELSGFYLLYNLASDFFLVHPETYKNCMSADDAEIYENSYGTSVDTYVGFGPYKLTYYQADNSIEFAKNPHWHGYADAENANYYQTTNIRIVQVADSSTMLNMFLAGDLDSYSLQAADMEDYQSSPYTYYQDGDSTWFVALNPDIDGLTSAQSTATPEVEGREVNKTILTIKEFRQALSFSLDRAAYALAMDPLGGTAKALYGNMIISDPNTGTAYRTTEEAKDAILEFWGLTDLVGTVYETKDEAIASITGYDLAGAKVLFDKAYDKAVADGLIKNPDNFEIQIVVGKPSEHDYYNRGFEYLKKVWTDAVAGTKLEGHLVFKQSAVLGQNFSDYLKKNQVDVLFGVGWTGSSLDPYGLMEAYVSPDYQYDPGWDTSATSIDVTLTDLDGKEVTLRASVFAWGAEALNGIEIKAMVVGEDGQLTGDYVMLSAGTTCDASIRLKILAAVETAVLNQYDMIPINLDASANMKGMQIKYGVEEYVFGVGRGGIKYMSYNYSDSEWAAYVAANAKDGQLNYKA